MQKKENLKNYTVCFTGHRKIPERERETLALRLRETVVTLIERGYRYFGVGGALGFDTLAAKTVLDLKCDYPQIKLILVLPCKNQTEKWSEYDKTVYNEILKRADKVRYLYENYEQGCMHARNRLLVDESSVCVCYHTHSGGGTDYTVGYAYEKKIEVINLASWR